MIKLFFKMLGGHAACAIAFLLFILLLPGIITFKLGEVLYSLFAIIVFFDVFYTIAWNYADKQRKNIKIYNNHISENEEKKKLSYIPMIVIGVLYTLFNMALFAMSYIFHDPTEGISTVIYRVWFSPFFILYKYSVEHINHLCFLLTLFPLVSFVCGYISGVYNFNIAETFANKLVYKKQDQSK